MLAKEPVSETRFVVFVCPELTNYGYSSLDQIFGEINARVKLHVPNHKSLNQISRVLYGMQLVSFPGRDILKMVQMQPTSVWRTYWFVDFPNGGRLYIEEIGKSVQLFMMSDGNSEDFKRFVSII